VEDIKTKELAEIIVDSVIEEPYFSKESLVPKITALITGFRLNLATTNYKQIGNKTKVSRLIRSNELQNLERNFWKNELSKIVGKENMKNYYEKLDIERSRWMP
jgi:hypothetical protein